MQRLLRDRLFRVLLIIPVLCILIFAGAIGYQRWRFVQRAYAEAARFGYTEDNFLVAEEHCGDPWFLWIPPPTCYLRIYFTTDMTRDQLVQFMFDQGFFDSYVKGGALASARTLQSDIAMYGTREVTMLLQLDGEWWGFVDRDNMEISFWPSLSYTVDDKTFRNNVIGVGTRR
jgi:hypothetical protein